MTYQVRSQGDTTIVALSGDVDLDTSPKVRSVLLESVGKKQGVLVEMSDVSYIDSSGIASLVEAYQSARRGSTPFALVAVSGVEVELRPERDAHQGARGGLELRLLLVAYTERDILEIAKQREIVVNRGGHRRQKLRS